MAKRVEKQECEERISEIVCQLFRTMLQTEVANASEADSEYHSVVTAAVEFGGTWKGVLELGCTHAQATCFAQRFLQTDVVEFDQEVHDVIGEMANIIAGNLKLALPANVSLGTPRVAQTTACQVRTPHGRMIGAYPFTSDMGQFSIRLIEDHSEMGSGQ